MKNKDIEKRLIRKIVVLLSIVIGVIGVAGFVLSRKSVASTDYSYLITDLNMDNEEELEQRRNERDQALAEAQAAHERAAALNEEKSTLTGELEYLNGLSEEQRAQYDIISAQYAAALDAKTIALNTYVQAQDDLKATQEAFKKRVAVMFEYQDKSYLEILLESDSIAGFFTNMEIISLITESDNQAIQELMTAKDNAEAQAELALQEAEDMERIAEEKLAQLEELESRIGVTEEALDDISTDIAYWEQREDELEAYSQSLDAQIAEIQRQYYAEQNATATTTAVTTTTEGTTASTVAGESTESAQTSSTTAAPTPTPTPVPTTPPATTSNGSLSWPTWNHTITSYYGNRVHPVYGTVKFHSGIDIGAWFGDTIMASASGTVIYVEEPCPGQDYGGTGYGNYCIIDHGNGVSTLYGHARDITVSTGDYVSAGQAIGVVGSTGTSSGAHLHFEVRIWGSNTDPLGYLP